MNFSLIAFLLGRLSLALSAILLLPVGLAIFYVRRFFCGICYYFFYSFFCRVWALSNMESLMKRNISLREGFAYSCVFLDSDLYYLCSAICVFADPGPYLSCF